MLDWTNGANWLPTNAPIAGDDIVFNTSGNLTFTILPINEVYNSLTILRGNVILTRTMATTFTLGGNPGLDLSISLGAFLTLRNSVNINLADSATAQINGTLTVNSNRSYNTNATAAVTIVNGKIFNGGSVLSTNNVRLIFNSGSTYEHAQNGGNIPDASWHANSTILISGIITTAPTNHNQNFGHFIWNSLDQSTTISFSNNISIQGNMSVLYTNGQQLRFDDNTANVVGGNYLQSNGTVIIRLDSIHSLTVRGNFSISNSTFLNEGDNNPGGVLNIGGNFSLSPGGILNGGNLLDVIFNASGTQTFTSGGMVSGTTNFTVNSGSTLQMAAPGTIVFGNSFTLSSGATIGIRSIDGISSIGNTGNVQTTSRIFDSGASYIYNGTAAQNTGNGMPDTVSNLTIENNFGAVSLNNAKTISNHFSITNGSIANLGNFTHSTSVLFLDGIAKQTGSWGSSSSPALNKNNIFFSATTGFVNVSNKLIFTNIGSSIFKVPNGVTGIAVEAWGGGGAGGAATGNPSTGGGGAGGSFAKLNNFSVTEGDSIFYFIGAGGIGGTGNGETGGNSWFHSDSTLLAQGGAGGAEGLTIGSNGIPGIGSKSISVGDTTYAGGNGSMGDFSSGIGFSGAGGGAAGTTGSGANASLGIGGSGRANGGGNGAHGVGNDSIGKVGFIYGGAGSGGKTNTATAQPGGSGANGHIIIYLNAEVPCEEPTFTNCPSLDIHVISDTGLCTADVIYIVTADGDPTPNLYYEFTGATIDTGSGTGTGEIFNVGTTFVTITATNGCSPDSSCVFNVVVEDDENPVAICRNVTVLLDNTGNGSTTAAAVNNGSSDACGIASLSLSQTAFNCSHVGGNTVTLTVTDVNGQTSTCTSTVTVQDNVAPNAICQNVTVQLDNTGNGSTTASAINNGSTDACGIQNISLSQTNFTCNHIGANAVTLTVTDANGKKSTCTATITVEDKVAPVAICQNVILELNSVGTGNITASAVNNGSTDACGIQSFSLSQIAFTCNHVGINPVILTVTDMNGNSLSCTATVTVEDNVAPIVVCKDISVNLNALGNVSIQPSEVYNTGSDNCSLVNLQSVNPSILNCLHVSSTIVTLTVNDGNGNTSTCSATVTVRDVTNPTFTCPTSTSVNPNTGACHFTISGTDYDPAMINDNCGVASVENNFNSSSSLHGAIIPTGANMIVWTITDVNGLTNTCSFTFTVNACMTFTGTIFHKGDGVEGVKDVTVTLSGDATDSHLTDESGTYSLIANNGDDFEITPNKNINFFNGVDAGDASRISQHLDGNYLTDFFRLVSADVNKSSTITTVDASILKQALLGNTAVITFLNSIGAWRFVPTNGVPSGPYGPVTIPTFPENRIYAAAIGNYTEQDFFGIKTADVLEDADPKDTIPETIPPMVWKAQDRSLTSGEIIEVEFSVQDWKNLVAFQFSFDFDTSVLEFEDLELLQTISDFNKSDNFGIVNVQNGELRVVFTVADSTSVLDATKVFKIRFKVLQSTLKLSDVLSFSTTVLNPIAYTGELISAEVKLVFTEGPSISIDPSLDGKVELLQNRPNPFSNFTSIGFILPSSMDARLNIYDASGRMLWMVKKSYSAGYHEEKIHLNETLTPGVYFYELTTIHGSLTKRMILIQE